MNDSKVPTFFFGVVIGLFMGVGICAAFPPAPHHSPETTRALIEFDQWRAIYTDFLRQGKSITEAADLTDEAMEVIGYHTPAREE